MDKKQRTWLSIIIEMGLRLQVLLCQEEVVKGQATSPSQLRTHRLPLMWQLYPGNRYQDSDSNFFRIIYHVKFNQQDDIMLEQMLDPEETTN